MAEVPEDELVEGRGPDRRTVVRGGAVLGLAALAGLPVAGCGGGSSQVAGDVPAAPPVPVAPSGTSVPRSKSQLYRRGEGDVAVTEPLPTRTARPVTGSTEPQAPTAAPAAPSKSDGLSTARRRPETSRKPGALGRADDIPVGGGKVYEKQKVVVTQPTRGEYKAFDARCTHQGCTVSDVHAGTIHCPCHQSQFSLGDGSVINGPAKRPLPVKPIEVVDGEIREVRPAPTAD